MTYFFFNIIILFLFTITLKNQKLKKIKKEKQLKNNYKKKNLI